MRNRIVLLLGLALVAVACGSADDGSVAAEVRGEIVTADTAANAAPEPTDAAPSAQSADTAAAASTDLAAATNACGFEHELSPEIVAVEQILGTPLEAGLASALTSMDNPRFPEPLVDIERIRSGGPPPDGIPPIDSPVFQTADSVDWLQCNEPVLVLQVGDDARAYPIQVMTWHELVNDTFGDVPVTVSYCPLCNSALAYRRDLGDRIFTFGTSGRLFNSSLVMYDRQTESLWTHFNGAAVVGVLTGTQLELLPMQTTSWANFRDAHPDGLVLTRDTGFRRNYGSNPYPGYDDVTENPFLFDGEPDGRLAAKQRVVALRSGGESAAVVLDDLAVLGVIDVELDGEVVTVWHVPGTSTGLESTSVAGGRDVGAVGVFVPEIDGELLSFSRQADGLIVDEGGSTWNILGRAVAGPLEGEQLEPVEHLDTFWFAIAAFEPDTTIVRS